MQKKPHATEAKDAKAKSDEEFWIPDFNCPFREWIDQGKMHCLRALGVRQAFRNWTDSAEESVNSRFLTTRRPARK
jgi:hypothetical protein